MIGFTVSDMEWSVAFYERVLGFEKVAELQITGSEYDALGRYRACNVDFVPVWGRSHAAFRPTARTRVSRSSMTR